MRDIVRTASYAGPVNTDPGRRCLFIAVGRTTLRKRQDLNHAAQIVNRRRILWKFYITAPEGMRLR